MSLMPRGSDDIAGLLGVGALIGALTGARAPKRGSRPGLLSTLLARSIEEERAAQEARIRQEQAQMAFLRSIAPKMLEMGIRWGISSTTMCTPGSDESDEMNKGDHHGCRKGILPHCSEYAPHATQDQLAGLASGDYHRAADFFVSDANRDVHRNAALFPALMQQLGSANGLLALSGMSGRESDVGRRFDVQQYRRVSFGARRGVEGGAGRRVPQGGYVGREQHGAAGRCRTGSMRRMWRWSTGNLWKLIQAGMPLGSMADLSDPKGSIEKVSKAARRDACRRRRERRTLRG